MRARVLFCVWAFIFAAAAYDAWFAWQHRDLIEFWEQNPFAAWAIDAFGLMFFLFLKFVCLSFAAAMAAYCWMRMRKSLVWPLTLTIALAYGTLSAFYLANFDELSITPAPIPLSLQQSLP